MSRVARLKLGLVVLQLALWSLVGCSAEGAGVAPSQLPRADVRSASDLTDAQEEAFLIDLFATAQTNDGSEPMRTVEEALDALGPADRARFIENGLSNCADLRERTVEENVFSLQLLEAMSKDNGSSFRFDDWMAVAVDHFCPSQADNLGEVLRAFNLSR